MQEDIYGECSKIGEVSKITLFAKHIDGVVVIKFASSGSAARCVEIMKGRFFAGRKLECGFWDGTDYTHRESKNEEKERVDKFQEWLEEGSSSSDSEANDEEQTKQNEKPARGNEVHSGRDIPRAADGSDDSDLKNNDDANYHEDMAIEVHTDRVMPNLGDLDDE